MMLPFSSSWRHRSVAMVSTLRFLLLIVTIAPASAVMRKGYGESLENRMKESAGVTLVHACGRGDFCEDDMKDINTPIATPGDCMCVTSAEGDCSCVGDKCSEQEQRNVCAELLGPCVCERSEESCECSGYCHIVAERREACAKEDGCSWMGQSCEAVVAV
mmetsp:Transcript_57238/g.90999  ORF Transcript_57238/g.90999 Transcript_57238/m.90999 type:complete len:161 (-) Transcript_57238:49-531(-)